MGTIFEAGRKRLAVLALAISFLVGIFGAGQAYAIPTSKLSGTVRDSQGASVSGVTVYATAPGGSAVLSGPVVTNGAGKYSLIVVNRSSVYDVHFDPPAGSGLDPYVATNFAIKSSNVTLDAVLTATPVYYAASGVVTDALAQGVAGLTVTYAAASTGATTSVTTDASGAYSVSLPTDTYTVSIAKNDASVAPDYPFFTISEGNVTLGSNLAQNYQLPAVMHVAVTVRDHVGAPVASQPVGYDANDVSASAVTDDLGVAQLPQLAGVTIPAGTLCTTFTATNTQVCNAADLAGDSDSSVELDAPEQRILSGTVTDANGVALVGALVTVTSQSSGSSVTATTNVKGQYSVIVSPDAYDVVISDGGNATLISKYGTFSVDEGVVDLSLGDATQNYQL